MAEARKNDTRDNNESMSVNEAGRRGGEATSQTHGKEFYEEIGHQGGQRVKELVEEGKEAEAKSPRRSTTKD
jgi:general stress protein YciG